MPFSRNRRKLKEKGLSSLIAFAFPQITFFSKHRLLFVKAFVLEDLTRIDSRRVQVAKTFRIKSFIM